MPNATNAMLPAMMPALRLTAASITIQPMVSHSTVTPARTSLARDGGNRIGIALTALAHAWCPRALGLGP